MAQLRHGLSEGVEGWLFKKGKMGRHRKQKHVQVESQMLIMTGDTSDAMEVEHSLANAKVTGVPGTLTIKLVIDGGKTIMFVAPNRQEYEKWVEVFRRAASTNVEEYYELGNSIGEGAFAKVVLGTDKSTLETCAVKIINKQGTEVQEKEMNFIHRELRIMKTINHPCVVKTHDIFDTKLELYIVMEYMPGGTLADAMRRKVLRTERQVREILREIITGVQYLHQNNIVHRDLKLKNILCKNQTYPLETKLADFGLSNFVGVRTMSRSKLQSQVGSPHYVAPEVLHERPYGRPVDMWSCGVILHIMLTGKYPFAGATIKETLELVSSGNFQMRGAEWNHVSTAAKQFIKGLFIFDPKERMTADQALAHQWMMS